MAVLLPVQQVYTGCIAVCLHPRVIKLSVFSCSPVNLLQQRAVDAMERDGNSSTLIRHECDLRISVGGVGVKVEKLGQTCFCSAVGCSHHQRSAHRRAVGEV